ncbi:MAG: polysaccharide biosynthesis C-terminal domain-containing protein, partial [Selenomonadaceae bacterium]
ADIGLAACINLYFLYRYIGYKMEIGQVLRTVAAAAVMGLAVFFSYDYILAQMASNALATFGAVLIGCGVYLLVLLLLGGIKEEDIVRIPILGASGARLLQKAGVFKSRAR